MMAASFNEQCENKRKLFHVGDTVRVSFEAQVVGTQAWYSQLRANPIQGDGFFNLHWLGVEYKLIGRPPEAPYREGTIIEIEGHLWTLGGGGNWYSNDLIGRKDQPARRWFELVPLEDSPFSLIYSSPGCAAS
jgi:hypothetical protein